MNSEEVVDYINEEMKKEKKLSKICDTLFFKCLAEDNYNNDGSGCDNQTCIIIKLKDLPEKEADNSEADKLESDCKLENQDDNKVHEIKIVNESSEKCKRKREDDAEIEITNTVNGNNSSIESPSTKKTKSELES